MRQPRVMIVLFALIVLNALRTAGATATVAPIETMPRVIDAPAVDVAVKRVRDDPNLSGKKTERQLFFKKPNRDSAQTSDDGSKAWQWVVDFFKWLSEVGRVLMWTLGGVAAIAVLLGLKRWLEVRGKAANRSALAMPSHVRELDIRPESLPNDIGAAAWTLWHQAADDEARRAALSLLYRGALSRLVHVWHVLIRASSTEGECLALARRRFATEKLDDSPIDRGGYVAVLIDSWQRAVYSLRVPSDETVRALCQRFGAVLDVAPDTTPDATPDAAPSTPQDGRGKVTADGARPAVGAVT